MHLLANSNLSSLLISHIQKPGVLPELGRDAGPVKSVVRGVPEPEHVVAGDVPLAHGARGLFEDPLGDARDAEAVLAFQDQLGAGWAQADWAFWGAGGGGQEV